MDTKIFVTQNLKKCPNSMENYSTLISIPFGGCLLSIGVTIGNLYAGNSEVESAWKKSCLVTSETCKKVLVSMFKLNNTKQVFRSLGLCLLAC